MKGKITAAIAFFLFFSTFFILRGEENKPQKGLKPITSQDYSSKPRLHPPITLLDEDGRPVLKTSKPVSTRKTCGKCHDYDFITSAYHFQQGANEWSVDWGDKNGERGSISPGMFGRQYDYPYYHMTPPGWKEHGFLFEYGRPNWALQCGICHLGGGPTEFSFWGKRLDTIPEEQVKEMDPDFYYWDRKSNLFRKWSWKRSGVREANCLVCHSPDYSKAIQDQRTTGHGIFKTPHFSSSTSAGLITTGIVKGVSEDGRVIYNPEAFYPDGRVKPQYLNISGAFARKDACLQCHAAPVRDGHVDPWYNYPVVRTINRGVLRKGFVWSGKNISEVKDNIEGKENLNFPWDVHARAGLTCLDCHVMGNSPGGKNYSVAEYLKRPDHNFGKGHPLTWRVRTDLDFTVKRCSACHDARAKGHDWLPEKELHLRKVSCEACHMPKNHYWMLNSFNFALPRTAPFSKGVKAEGACGDAPQRFTILGVEGNPIEDPGAKIVGFYPLYIPRRLEKNGERKIVPYGVTFSLHWVDDATGNRVYFSQILNAFFVRKGDVWVPKKEVLEVFDSNGNGKIEDEEALFDTPEKVALGERLLKAQGVKDPQLEIVAIPNTLAHNIAPKEKAIKSCDACHSNNSRIFNQGKYSRVIFDRPVLFKRSYIYNKDYRGIEIAKVEGGKTVWTNQYLLADFHLLGAIKPEAEASRAMKMAESLGLVVLVLTLVGILFHIMGRVIIPKK